VKRHKQELGRELGGELREKWEKKLWVHRRVSYETEKVWGAKRETEKYGRARNERKQNVVVGDNTPRDNKTLKELLNDSKTWIKRNKMRAEQFFRQI